MLIETCMILTGKVNTGLEQFFYIIIHVTKRTQFKAIQANCIKTLSQRILLTVSRGWMELNARVSCECLYCWHVQGLPRSVHGRQKIWALKAEA